MEIQNVDLKYSILIEWDVLFLQPLHGNICNTLHTMDIVDWRNSFWMKKDPVWEDFYIERILSRTEILITMSLD